jgi:hypothetical protein
MKNTSTVKKRFASERVTVRALLVRLAHAELRHLRGGPDHAIQTRSASVQECIDTIVCG